MTHKNYIIAILVAVPVVIAAGAYLIFFGAELPGVGEDNAGLAARVNGEEITLETYNERFLQAEANLKINGVNISSAEAQEGVKKQVIDALVNEALILQLAKQEGISATTEEVDGLVKNSRKQFPNEEDFQAALLAESFSEASLRDFMEGQLVVQKVLEDRLDFDSLAATEAEVQEYYEKSTEGSEVFPRLEEVKDQIESMVLREKQQTLVVQFIEKLRQAGDIEIFI